MSTIEVSDYTVVAEARGQRVLWFRRFGSYQGEWLLFSRDDEHYFIYKDWYGSCSGCDSFEAEFGWGEKQYRLDDAKIVSFIAAYHPFLKTTHAAALGLAEKGSLLAVLPRNTREWRDIDDDNVGRQLSLIVKGDQGVISAPEILELDNQEIRREAIERFGAERFVTELDPVLIDADGDNFLYRAKDWSISNEPYVFLYVKDPSTERRYVIRVAPGMETVQAARASTFRMTAEQFVLAQET